MGAAAAVTPWTYRNYRLFGALVPVSTNGGISVWTSYNPASRGLGSGREGGYWAAVAEDQRLRDEREQFFRKREQANKQDKDSDSRAYDPVAELDKVRQQARFFQLFDFLAGIRLAVAGV